MVPQLFAWGYGIPGYVNKYCFRTAGLTIFLPEFHSVRHSCECISEFSLEAPREGSVVLGSPGEGQSQHRLSWCRYQELRLLSPVALSTGPQVLLVVESLASRVGADAPWENGGEGARGGEEARKWRHACQVWLVSPTQPRSFLLLGDFTPEVARGPWVGGHHLGGGLEKQP